MQDRNRCKKRIHAALTRNGVRVEKPSTRRGREQLEEVDLLESNRAVVEANLAVMATLKREIEELEKIIEMKVEEDPRGMLLTPIPGISRYSARSIKGG